MTEIVPQTINYEVKELKEGEFKVTQIPTKKPEDLNSGSRKEFSFDFKVFSCHGYIDTDEKEIAVWPSVCGIKVGDGYKAGLSSGIQIQLVLVAYNGSVRFFAEGGYLKINLHLKPLLPWGSDVDTTGNICSI